MPYSTIADRHAKHYDALTVIRSVSATALSATGSATAIALDVAKFDEMNVAVEVQAFTGTIDASNNWAISVEVSTTSGGTYTSVGSMVIPSNSAATYLIPVKGFTVGKLVPGAMYIRTTATKTGTIGNLSYGSYLTPDC